MSHLVESMAYSGVTPWHGLGNHVTANQPIEHWAKQAGMDWYIKESCVRYLDQDNDVLSSIHTFPDSKVLFRSDNLMPLSVVSKRYQVVQPQQILEFYRDLTERSGFILETAGVLKGGRKLWALARTGQSLSLQGNDVTNAYLLLATACDGTLATTAQFTSIRVVCNNTLAVALHDGLGAVKVPHNTTFDADIVKQQLGLSISSWDGFSYRMRALSQRRVKNAEVDKWVRRIYTDNNAQVNEVAIKKTLELYEGHGRGSQLSSSKGTAFGLLNAVTEYVDHQRRARSVDYRLDSAQYALQQLYPSHHAASSIDCREDMLMDQRFTRLCMVKKEMEALCGEEAQLKQHIQQVMGVAERALFSDGMVTWRQSKASNTFDVREFTARYPKLAEQFKRVKKASRRFLVYSDKS